MGRRGRYNNNFLNSYSIKTKQISSFSSDLRTHIDNDRWKSWTKENNYKFTRKDKIIRNTKNKIISTKNLFNNYKIIDVNKFEFSDYREAANFYGISSQIISKNFDKIFLSNMYDYEKNITKINLVSKRNKIDINGFVSELNENFSIIRPLNLTYKLSINEFKKIKFSVDDIDWYLVSDNSDELKYPNLFVHNWFVPYDGKIFLNFGNIKNLIYWDIKSHYFGCSFFI